MVRKRHPFSGFSRRIYSGYPCRPVFLGGLGAWYIGGVWIEQFVEGVDFGICGFLLIACIVLLLIIGCVVFKAWRIANENPVDSIKSE
mgnify:FL=1